MSSGLLWTTAVLAGTWGNHTAAFFGGRACGRRKLLVLVSPGKTSEGFIAGFFGGIISVAATAGALGLDLRHCVAVAALRASSKIRRSFPGGADSRKGALR